VKEGELGRGNSINSPIVAETGEPGLKRNAASNMAAANPNMTMWRVFILESNVQALATLGRG
jgi:hypothetical protein